MNREPGAAVAAGAIVAIVLLTAAFFWLMFTLAGR